MATFLTTADFSSGPFAVPQDRFTELDSYIEKYEKQMLLKLLGADLYAAFMSDCSGNPLLPAAAIYLSIFNEFETDDAGCLLVSEGIKEMLKQFVYFYFMRDNEYKKTVSGAMQASSENYQNKGYNGWNLVEAYNAGVKNTKAIQWFIQENDADYPLFNGSNFQFISGY
jgi:hypothetical protein